jgi:hypothetical protein
MGLMHRPPFVGCGGEASGEQDSFVFAEARDFSQKPFRALPIFFTCRNLFICYGRVNAPGAVPSVAHDYRL